MSEILRFIRKGGRIIPIRSKKEKDTAKAIGYTSAGTGVAVGGAVVSGNLFKNARLERRMASSGAQNIMARNSALVNLNSFHLKSVGGKVFKKSGVAKRVLDQQSLFSYSNLQQSNAYLRSRAKSSYGKALLSKRVMKLTSIVPASLIGLGVEKAISASGAEKVAGHEYLSEISGVGVAHGTMLLSESIFDKVGKSIPLRKSFSSKALKILSKIKFKM